MFCSIIIPTVGRASLARSVNSILDQNFTLDDFEIIVVNDSGELLPSEKWQESTNVQIVTTQRRERCFARNTGAAIASGTYFCFLDDDDWLLPNSLELFWALTRKHPNAAWLYGGVHFVDASGKTLGYLNQGKTGNCFLEVMTETWIPIQASFIKADVFFQVGGYDPDFVGTEDLNLLRHIALKYDLLNTSQNVACMQRGYARKSETNYSIGWYFIALGRERLLAEKNALPRLMNAARSSNLLHGYVLRNYMIATLFNLRQHQWSKSFSRFLKGVRSFFQSFKYIFAKDYWRALNHKHPLHLDLIDSPSPDYECVEDWLY